MARANIGDVLREAGGALGAVGTQRRLSRQEEEQRMKEEKAAKLAEFLLQQQGITDAPVQGALGAGGITPQGIASLLPQQEGQDKPPKIKTFPGTVGGKPAVANIDVSKPGVVEFPVDFVPTEKKEKPDKPRADEVYTPQEAMDDVGRWIKGLLPGIPPTPGQKALIGKGLDVIYDKKFSDEEIDIWLEGANEEEIPKEKSKQAGFFKNLFSKIFGGGADANQVTKTGLKTINTQEEYDALPSGKNIEYIDGKTGQKARKP